MEKFGIFNILSALNSLTSNKSSESSEKKDESSEKNQNTSKSEFSEKSDSSKKDCKPSDVFKPPAYTMSYNKMLDIINKHDEISKRIDEKLNKRP